MTAPLRVAQVIASIADEAAGPSYTVPALCSGLALQGASVELHVLDDGPRSLRPGAPFALRAHRRSRALTRVEPSSSMKRALRQQAFDVFHSHGLWRMPGLYAAEGARRARAPHVISARGMLEPAALQFSPTQKRIFWTAGQGAALAQAACLHATSQGELESIRRIGLRNPVAVIANGVDLPEAQPHVWSAEERTLLFLGRIHPIKALDRLLQAWSTLERQFPRWKLRIVGRGTDAHEAWFRETCERLGAQRVECAGAAFGADKLREFAEAQLYVLPSHSENFGMTIAEALACGVPVVASRGTPWAGLEEHRCGLWVDNSVESLGASLRSLLERPPTELAAMGERGRAWMQNSFSWAAKSAEMLSVYEWLLGRIAARPSCVDAMNGAARPGNWSLGAYWPPW